MTKSDRYCICKIKLPITLVQLLKLDARCWKEDLNECFIKILEKGRCARQLKNIDINKALQDTEEKLRGVL